MKKLTLNKNDKFYLDFFALYGNLHENIDKYLDNIFYMLLDPVDIKFQENYILIL
jgi:hypothetical protein